MVYGPFRKAFGRLAPGLVFAALALACAPAWANCQLDSVAALPVTMLGMRALLPAKINGQDVQFVVDSGAFYSTISTANADKFKLPRSKCLLGRTMSLASAATPMQRWGRSMF
jgi:hypothetical protein